MITRLMLNLRDPKLMPGSHPTTSRNTTIKFITPKVVSAFFNLHAQTTDFMGSEGTPQYHTGIAESNDNQGPSRSASACVVELDIY
jgi:hypothetical protein